MNNQALTTQGKPPEHIEQLLIENGMSYDALSFNTMSIEEHAALGFKGLKVSVLAAVHAGMHFVACRELDRKFISAEAERQGISKHTIYNMIHVYELFSRSPEKLSRRLDSFGFYKLIELKHFTEEDLNQFSEGKEVYGLTLETAQSCSVRELKSITNEHKTELKTARQKLIDMESRMNIEADHAALLLEENRKLKALPVERASFHAMRLQIFEDMETAQGIVARARKTFEMADNFKLEIEADSIEAVIHPLLHLLSVLHGGSKLVAEDCYQRWGINPAVPINPPMPNTLTHEEKWKAEQSANYQAALTDDYVNKKINR